MIEMEKVLIKTLQLSILPTTQYYNTTTLTLSAILLLLPNSRQGKTNKMDCYIGITWTRDFLTFTTQSLEIILVSVAQKSINLAVTRINSLLQKYTIHFAAISRAAERYYYGNDVCNIPLLSKCPICGTLLCSCCLVGGNFKKIVI